MNITTQPKCPKTTFMVITKEIYEEIEEYFDLIGL